jgi:hypothetical protein
VKSFTRTVPFPMRFFNAAVFCSAVLFAGTSASSGAVAPAGRLEFAIGEVEGEAPAASVTVQRVVAAPKKRTLLPNSNHPVSIADGVAVRFALLKTSALSEMPAALRALLRTTQLQMRRLALFAPGDPVPRLMAEETFLASGEWLLKRVLLADRPAAKECKLVWRPGEEPFLTLAKGNSLALNSLLAPPKTP